jgi:hypothetical protein
MPKLIFNFAFVIMILACAIPSESQDKNLPNKAQAGKGLEPVFQSSLGNVLSNTLPSSVMKKLLDSSLHARDKKGKTYPVISFDLGYQQKETVTNDTTGKPETSHVYLYWHFKGNRLDSLWRKKIKDELKPGDQLYFDHIIAEGDSGAKYLSAPLHFTVH